MILLYPSGRRLLVSRYKEPGQGLLRSLIRDSGVIPDILKGGFRSGN